MCGEIHFTTDGILIEPFNKFISANQDVMLELRLILKMVICVSVYVSASVIFKLLTRTIS